MTKKILAVIMCAIMVMALAACGSTNSSSSSSGDSTTASSDSTTGGDSTTASSDSTTNGDSAAGTPEVTLVFAEVNPLDTIVGQMDTAFKEKVEELSGGKIKIDIQPSGVLGSENDVLDTMLGGGGTIDMSRISAFALTSYGGEKSKLLSIPYTFVNREHFWKFAESDMAEEFLAEPAENKSGVRGLFYGEEGFRHFFTVDEVSGLEDFKGKKLRVSNDPIMNGMVEGLGAYPTVVDFNELYSALQTGVVDGAEQPIANYKSNAFHEVAPTMILDGHTLGAVQVIITDEAWDSLTEEQQGILKEAGKYASSLNKTNSADAENKVLEELKAAGVKIVEVTDIAPWQEACKAIIESSSASNKDLYQKILDLK